MAPTTYTTYRSRGRSEHGRRYLKIITRGEGQLPSSCVSSLGTSPTIPSSTKGRESGKTIGYEEVDQKRVVVVHGSSCDASLYPFTLLLPTIPRYHSMYTPYCNSPPALLPPPGLKKIGYVLLPKSALSREKYINHMYARDERGNSGGGL